MASWGQLIINANFGAIPLKTEFAKSIPTDQIKINFTKKQISEIFDISDVTISKTYRKIYPYYKIILNNKVTNLVLQKKALVNPDKNEVSESNLVLKEQLKKELLEDIDEASEEEEDDEDELSNNEEEIISVEEVKIKAKDKAPKAPKKKEIIL